jgi:hypothetical protein
MAAVDPAEHDFELFIRESEREFMFEAIAVELIRAGSIARAQVTLLGIIEPCGDRDWREIGPAWTVEGGGFWTLQGRVARAQKERPGGGSWGRSNRRAVPWGTIDHWIRNELRPRGLLAPSSGRGRPRRGASKFAPGPALDKSLM